MGETNDRAWSINVLQSVGNTDFLFARSIRPASSSVSSRDRISLTRLRRRLTERRRQKQRPITRDLEEQRKEEDSSGKESWGNRESNVSNASHVLVARNSCQLRNTTVSSLLPFVFARVSSSFFSVRLFFLSILCISFAKRARAAFPFLLVLQPLSISLSLSLSLSRNSSVEISPNDGSRAQDCRPDTN